VPKNISKHRELVKLCHINLSGPVFLRHSVLIEFHLTSNCDRSLTTRRPLDLNSTWQCTIDALRYIDL